MTSTIPHDIAPARIVCGCGSNVLASGYRSHQKTKKHMTYTTTTTPVAFNDRIVCGCGSNIKVSGIKAHLRTYKHQSYITRTTHPLTCYCGEQVQPGQRDIHLASEEHRIKTTLVDCTCGAKVLERNMPRHKRYCTQAQRPTALVQMLKPTDCDICYEPKTKFRKCTQCDNIHCRDCYKHLPKKRCPFCRFSFRARR